MDIKNFIKVKGNKIGAIIESNDKTLVVDEYVEIRDKELFDDIRKNIDKYEVKDGKMIKEEKEEK